MTVDRAALRTSWNQTRGHLDAARVHLTGLPNIDLSATLEFLEHNELELAFDCRVDLGDDLDLSLTFWQHLDRAAREMRLHSKALHKPHLTAADLCRRHVAAASETEQPAPGGPARSDLVGRRARLGVAVDDGHPQSERALGEQGRRPSGIGSLLVVEVSSMSSGRLAGPALAAPGRHSGRRPPVHGHRPASALGRPSGRPDLGPLSRPRQAGAVRVPCDALVWKGANVVSAGGGL
ncbi:MafI family immunity protein [Streptomyces sp. NPDC001981]|uniref:MafI family immunity protein n=1 Tax=Streptomyces sp. NPDC001981 TaxID=3364628 RepID=UPI0036B1A2E2